MAVWACSQNCVWVALRQVVRKRQDLTNVAVGVRELSATPSGNLRIQQFQQTHWALLRSLDSKTSRNHCALNTCPCSPPTHPITCFATESSCLSHTRCFKLRNGVGTESQNRLFQILYFFVRMLLCFHSAKD